MLGPGRGGAGVKDGLAAVQVAGYMRLPCAAALTVGYAQLALDSSSKLAAGTGRGGLVVEVDGGTCGVIFLLRKGGALYGTF